MKTVAYILAMLILGTVMLILILGTVYAGFTNVEGMTTIRYYGAAFSSAGLGMLLWYWISKW